jgi:methanogenic corrinoid protein MtbC1
MAVLDDLKQAIISGNRDKAKEMTQKALSEGIPARKVVVDGIAAAMEVVGEKFRTNEFFVPELLIAQRAMKESLKLMSGEAVDYVGTVVIGTVKMICTTSARTWLAAMLEGRAQGHGPWRGRVARRVREGGE